MKVLKILGGFATAGLLAFAGCVSGAYVTDVSVERRAGGVSDYTLVPWLPDGELSASMPVVMETKSRTEMGVHVGNNLLWLVTLGIVPGISSEATVYDVTVRTPLGERSGTCTVEARSWHGWLALFMPYLGSADERVADPPRLPNANLEKKTRDRLVAKLVSQFPKEEYESCVAKWNSPDEKVRRAKKADERLLALYGNLEKKAGEHDYVQIRRRYSEGRRYLNPFPEAKECSESDWLARWSSPRLPLAEADALAGEACLSEFGAKYLPNAYANYEKRREALAEIQQVFNEEFPQPWTIRETSPKWHAFNKVLERFVQARTEAFLCHDEFCHYWLLWRFGVLSAGDLAAADAERLSVPLLPESVTCAKLGNLSLKPLEGKIADFAAKYAPASSGLHQKMAREFKEIDVLLAEIGKQRRQMDDVRHSRALEAAVAKRKDLAHELDALSFQLQTWHIEHRTAVKSADDLARCDADMVKKLKPFLDSLPVYVKARTIAPVIVASDSKGCLMADEPSPKKVGPVIDASELVVIPNRGYRLQRTEVTQRQWEAIMGSNPSKFRGPDRPVENVSWYDCQEFIKRASAMDGRPYRLPTSEEWKYACLAGSTDDSGRRANGRCGPLDMMGWFKENSGGETHPVAQKEPNAWGLYDMHGNVREWCSDRFRDFDTRMNMGGSWYNDSQFYWISAWDSDNPDFRDIDLGFRLAVSQD